VLLTEYHRHPVLHWLNLGALLLGMLFAGLAQARGGLSLDQAVEQVRRQEGGRVISTQTLEQDGEQVYNIRLLKDGGRVKNIRIDSGERGRDRSPNRR